MGAILNGIALHGPTRPYGGTFLVFSDYMRPVGTPRRTAGAAGHLRVDARLHRPGRGRPDAPAGRAPRRAARHPGTRRHPARRRQRDGRRVAHAARHHRPAGRPRAQPAERARRSPAGSERVRGRCRCRPRRLHADRHRRRARRRSWWPPAPRCSSPSRRARSWPPTASRRGSCRCRAASGSSSRTSPTATASSLRTYAPASRSKQVWRRLARRRRRRRPHREPRALRRLGRLRHAVRASSASPPRPSSRPRTSPSPPQRPLARGSTPGPPARWDPATIQDAANSLTRHEFQGDIMNDRLQALADAGVSIWLDDLSRERIESGDLARAGRVVCGVVGVTTNPTIFASALADGSSYADQVAELKAVRSRRRPRGLRDHHHRRPECLRRPAPRVRRHRRGRRPGVDRGRPRRSPATPTRTIALAQKLWDRVDRPNLFIKIPATEKGLPAITETIADGISVNVTLIFSLDRYRGVMDAYLAGLEQAAGRRPGPVDIQSVASFFVSRVDSEVDKRLARETSPLRGKAAIANARLAYEAYEEVFGVRLAGQGSGRQGRATRSARCGRRPASRTRPTPTRCTSPSSSSPTPSTPCRRRRWTRSPTTARCAATRCTAPTTTHAR